MIYADVYSLQGKVYDAVNKERTHWNFEPTDNPRRRTASTASTMSTQSSYAYVSDPEISSSFAASLESAQVSDNDDSDFASPERSHRLSRDEQRQRMAATITIPDQRIRIHLELKCGLTRGQLLHGDLRRPTDIRKQIARKVYDTQNCATPCLVFIFQATFVVF